LFSFCQRDELKFAGHQALYQLRQRRVAQLPAWFAIPTTTTTAAAVAATTAAASTAATATITVTAAAAAASAAKSTASAAAPAIAAIFSRSRFVHGQVAAIKFFAVKLGDSCLAFFLGGHFDETETTGTSRVTIFNNGSRLDRARLGKKLLQILAGGLESEVAYIKFHGHVNAPLLLSQECQKKLESKWLRCNGSSESSCSDAQGERLL
jgi:hypothetical protein